MLLLLPSITLRIRIHVRRRAVPCAHTASRDFNEITTPISSAECWVISDTKHTALSHSGRTAAGRTGQTALSVTGHTALGYGNENASTHVDCHRESFVSSAYERKIPARVNAGNSTFEMISAGTLDQSAARAARLRAFGAAAPAASSGRSASCSKSRRSSQLEKLRPSRAASVRAKASRSARNDTLVWVLPRARTPWRLFVLGVLTPHHPRKLSTPQYKSTQK